MKLPSKKDVVEAAITQHTGELLGLELKEKFLTRKTIGSSNVQAFEQQLGKTQTHIKMTKELLEFYEKELKDLTKTK